MDEIIDLKSPLIREGIIVWTGYGQSPTPRRDSASLETRFGQETAAKLLPIIRSLEDEFYSSDARLTAADLAEMGKIASEQFQRKHPGIAEEIVRAFAWCYTFDYK